MQKKTKQCKGNPRKTDKIPIILLKVLIELNKKFQHQSFMIQGMFQLGTINDEIYTIVQ